MSVIFRVFSVKNKYLLSPKLCLTCVKNLLYQFRHKYFLFFFDFDWQYLISSSTFMFQSDVEYFEIPFYIGNMDFYQCCSFGLIVSCKMQFSSILNQRRAGKCSCMHKNKLVRSHYNFMT